MSIFVKPNGKTRVGFRQGTESTANVIFDLSGTGSVVSGNGFIERYRMAGFELLSPDNRLATKPLSIYSTMPTML